MVSSSSSSAHVNSDESRNVLVGTLCLVGGAILCVLAVHVAAYFFWKQAVKKYATNSNGDKKATKLLPETNDQAKQNTKIWTTTNTTSTTCTSPRLVLETIWPCTTPRRT